MPLRDHFRPPVSTRASWEGFHGMWPAAIVLQLRIELPPGYVAEPRVHLGAQFEIDVNAYAADASAGHPRGGGNGEGPATTTWTAARPIVAVELQEPDEYEYEVRVYDAQRGRTLVAAIEIVSPANKDRPEKRNAFVGKCAELLRRRVAVSIVDLVTVRQFNLYAELMAFIGRPELAGDDPPPTYAASCRWVARGAKTYLETWSQPLLVGQPLPTVPVWLAEDRILPLDLEPSYEQACHAVWIT